MKLEVKENNNKKELDYQNEVYRVVIDAYPTVDGGEPETAYGVENIVTGVVEFKTPQISEALSYAEANASFLEEDVHKRYRQSRVQTAQLAGQGVGTH